MTVTGYSTKYLFEFDSTNGTYYRIRIKKYDYNGSVIRRALGQAPVLKMENADNGICGTSLEIYAQCDSDGEFAELYTTSATEFYVTLGRVVNGNEAVIWSGFISPELYAEPDIAPPYDVQIIATDGLGELKLHEYTAQGRNTILAYLNYLLSQTGQTPATTDYYICNSLHSTDPSVAVQYFVSQTYINMDHLAGKTCYDVLVDILISFHFTISQYNNKWILLRENDITLSSGNLPVKNANGTSINIPTAQFGSMASYSWWPIDLLDKEIVPAKNRVTVVQPYNFKPSMLGNYDFDELTAWTTHNAEIVDFGVKLKPNHTEETHLGYIRQSISVENNTNGFNLAITMAMISRKNITELSTKAMAVEVQVKLITGSTTYYLQADEDGNKLWTNIDSVIELNLEPKSSVSSRDNLDEQSIALIPLVASGTVTVEVRNIANSRYSNTLYIGEVRFTQNEINGYKDILGISNSAREELDDFEIKLGDAPQNATNLISTIYNVLTFVQNPTKKWATTKIPTPAEFIKVIAQDYALSYALPRLRMSGKLNVPINDTIAPVFRDSSATPIIYVPEEWSWDLLNDEVDIKLLSAPAASITISSESVTELSNAEYGETSTGGNSSSSRPSGSGGGGGVVSASYWSKYDDTDDAVQYEGVEAAYPICATGKIFGSINNARKKMFELVNIGTEQAPVYAIHTPLALYSDLDISVGTPTQGQVVLPTTLLEVFQKLTNNPSMVEPSSYDNVAIHAAHLTAIWTMLATYDNVHSISAKFIKPFSSADAGKVLKINSAGSGVEWGEGGGSGGGGTVTQIVAGTGLSGGTITTSGTIAISSTYQKYINRGNTAYGWGNHADVGYLTSGSLSGYATVSWVQNQGYLTQHQSLAGYATQTWVGQQGYITSSAISDMATKTWVGQQNYLTTSAAASTYLPLSGGTITGNLAVSGTVQATELTATSDIRLKNNITELPDALSVVKGLRLFSHEWIDGRGERTIGVSAQELRDTPFGCLVYEDKNGYLSVSYQKLSVVALKAVQELEDRVGNLEAQIAELREMIMKK